MACERNWLQTHTDFSILCVCGHNAASLEGWGELRMTVAQQWTSWFRNPLAAVWNWWPRWQAAVWLCYVGEKVNVTYDSLLRKISGGDENPLEKCLQLCAFLGGEKNQERKRRVNETFVFKQERQDVGVIVISLNSSIHPQVLVIFVQQSVRSRQEV